MSSRSNEEPVELTRLRPGQEPDDVTAEDVIQIVKLWETLFGSRPMRLEKARVFLQARAEADRAAGEANGAAERLGWALVLATGRPKWNSRSIGWWLRRASKYRVSGCWLQPLKKPHEESTRWAFRRE